jgi:catechol 2,3-dioxygenase-like lactoylglutathione lyase family enzyme
MSSVASARSRGKERQMDSKLGQIGQIARTVKDIQQSEAWYRDVLGLRHLYTFGTLSFFDCGGTRLFLTQRDGNEAAESLIYFSVEDIETARDQLTARGVEFTHAPHRRSGQAKVRKSRYPSSKVRRTGRPGSGSYASLAERHCSNETP